MISLTYSEPQQECDKISIEARTITSQISVIKTTGITHRRIPNIVKLDTVPTISKPEPILPPVKDPTVGHISIQAADINESETSSRSLAKPKQVPQDQLQAKGGKDVKNERAQNISPISLPFYYEQPEIRCQRRHQKLEEYQAEGLIKVCICDRTYVNRFKYIATSMGHN